MTCPIRRRGTPRARRTRRRGCTPREGKRGQGTDRARLRCAGHAQRKGGTSLYNRVRSQHMACPSRRKGTPDPGGRGGGKTPRASCAPSAQHAGIGRRGGGQTPDRRRGGGAPPEQAHTPFMSGLIQEMRGNPQDLRRPPPTARRSKGGRGAPEEQARSIVARIINFPSGGGPHSGQTPALPQQARSI